MVANSGRDRAANPMVATRRLEAAVRCRCRTDSTFPSSPGSSRFRVAPTPPPSPGSRHGSPRSGRFTSIMVCLPLMLSSNAARAVADALSMPIEVESVTLEQVLRERGPQRSIPRFGVGDRRRRVGVDGPHRRRPGRDRVGQPLARGRGRWPGRHPPASGQHRPADAGGHPLRDQGTGDPGRPPLDGRPSQHRPRPASQPDSSAAHSATRSRVQSPLSAGIWRRPPGPSPRSNLNDPDPGEDFDGGWRVPAGVLWAMGQEEAVRALRPRGAPTSRRIRARSYVSRSGSGGWCLVVPGRPSSLVGFGSNAPGHGCRLPGRISRSWPTRRTTTESASETG